MALAPDDDGDPDDWEDEWNDGDWQSLAVVDRERLSGSWIEWGAKLLMIAVAVPLVMGVLALLLILAF